MSRNRLYIIVILFLLATNAATIVSIYVSRQKDKKTEVPVSDRPHESRMSFLWSELGLDEGQKDEFSRFNSEYNSRARVITNDLNDLRYDLIEEMSGAQPNKAKIDSIIEEFGRKHASLKRQTVDFYEQLYSVCDSQQRQHLGFFFRDMLNPEGMIYGRGRGGHGRGRMYNKYGPGHGRRQGMRQNRQENNR